MKPHTISFSLAVTIAITSCNKNETQQETSTDKVEQAQPTAPKHDELANKTMDLMGEFANTFTTITDLDTANAAAKKIDDIGDQFTAIAEELNKIDPHTLELRKEIKKKIEAKEA
jgi:hypothetical protein